MVEAFNGNPKHKYMGRSTIERLERTIMLANQAGLALTKIRGIKNKI